MPRPFVCSLVACLLAWPSLVSAQEPGPIDTDRPDQTESSALVPVRHLQLEFGLAYTKDSPNDRMLEAPTFLMRYGLVDRLELRLGFPTPTTQFDGGDTGIGDLKLGAKIGLWKEKGWRPEAALLVHTTLPTGSDDFSSGRFDPSFRFAFEHSLPRNFSLGYNVGVAWETIPEKNGPGRDTLSRFEYTVTLGHKFNDRWGAFVEIFGDTPSATPSARLTASTAASPTSSTKTSSSISPLASALTPKLPTGSSPPVSPSACPSR